MDFEKSYREVAKLVDNFSKNENHYLSNNYKEVQVRKDFIDKFFIYLGWDVNHETQKNPYEQEVSVEQNLKIDDTQKRADYAFYTKPNFRDPKLFVEAKKPAQNLFNPTDYFQSIRYAWNASIPIVVLMDFEELHIIDSRFKPDINTCLQRKIVRYHYKDYLDKDVFSKIYYLLSRESVYKGSIEKYAELLPKPKGKSFQKSLFPNAYLSIDESFLNELDDYRKILAESFKKSNPNLESEELTEAVQRTIDRLVFIRFLEDKIIEPEHYISEFGESNSAWVDFKNACTKLNTKYNGLVFKEHQIIDRNSFNAPDDNQFQEICENLCHLNTPYDFNQIPIHILGSIYERFLGKVVTVKGKKALVEEKEEVRKAGGVYYTPQYIVQSIVDNTVGKLLENKTPKEIAKLKIIDISCGSGSFLITVFDTIIRYLNLWYQEHPKEAKADGCNYKKEDGKWSLSLQQKKKVLKDNIFGVDLDYQAVEVTQLSLNLKLLEVENVESTNELQAMFKEKILPAMNETNIISRNSLVDTNIFEDRLFLTEKEKTIKPMNFGDTFPDIMKKGGFDVVIGNPPWSSKMPNEMAEYITKEYSLDTRNMNLFAAFYMRSLRILKKSGLLCLLIPKVFIKNTSYTNIRKYVLDNFTIQQFIDYGQFPGVASDAVCTVVKKEKTSNNIIRIKNYVEDKLLSENNIEQDVYLKNPVYAFSSEIDLDKQNLLDLIKNNSIELSKLCQIGRGIELGQQAYIAECSKCHFYIEYGEKYYNKNKKYICKNCKSKITSTDKKMQISSTQKTGIYNTVCFAGNNIRYYHTNGHYYVPPELQGINYKNSLFEGERIYIRRIAMFPIATFVNDKSVAFNTVYILNKFDKINPFVVLAILNSNLMKFYYEYTYNLGMNLTTQITIEYLSQLPIRVSVFNKEIIKKIQDTTLAVYKIQIDIDNAKTEKDTNYLVGKRSAMLNLINKQVYALYNLNESSIEQIESYIKSNDNIKNN